MSDKSGFINIHRCIQYHWIWTDANKLKWWLDILITVNHSPAKVNIGFDVFDCDRGQSLLSIGSWADRWKVSKDTARNFLTLLEREKMITRVSLGKSTRLTVCKYDDYQVSLHVKQTDSVRDPYTNKKNNKNKKNNIHNVDISVDFHQNENATAPQVVIKKPKPNKWIETFEARKKEFAKSLTPYVKTNDNPNGYPPEMVRSFFNYWTEPNISKSRMRWELEKTWSLSGRFATWDKKEPFGKKIINDQPIPQLIDHRNRT